MFAKLRFSWSFFARGDRRGMQLADVSALLFHSTRYLHGYSQLPLSYGEKENMWIDLYLPRPLKQTASRSKRWARIKVRYAVRPKEQSMMGMAASYLGCWFHGTF